MSVNKVILVGNLGADPEVRRTQSGQAVATLRVATTETWNSRENNQRQERTEWHSVTVWGRTAENCERFLKKGRSVYIEGRLQSREYQDKEGIQRRVWEVVADRVQFLGGGGGQGGGGQGGGDGGGSWGGGGGGQGGGGWGGGGGSQGGGGWGGGGQGGGGQGGGGWGGGQGGGGKEPPSGGEGPGSDDAIPF